MMANQDVLVLQGEVGWDDDDEGGDSGNDVQVCWLIITSSLVLSKQI